MTGKILTFWVTQREEAQDKERDFKIQGREGSKEMNSHVQRKKTDKRAKNFTGGSIKDAAKKTIGMGRGNPSSWLGETFKAIIHTGGERKEQRALLTASGEFFGDPELEARP